MSINNQLQAVRTYQKSELAYLQNYNVFINRANKKFQNFQDIRFNLGSTVNFDKPYRFTTTDSLIADMQAVEQRVESLTVDKVKTVAYEFNDEEIVFNVHDYMDDIGYGAVEELSSQVEIDVSSMARTTAYRCYGDGVTAINSYGQIADMLYLYRNYGAPRAVDVFLPDSAVPGIINSGLSQFVLKRNEETAQSWMLGNFDSAEYLRSNFLPLHEAGVVGNDELELTVVSTNDPTGANITEITFSCSALSEADAIFQYDTITFSDGVPGQENVRFRTFIGHAPSDNPVQLLASADAGTNGGGQVTVQFTPALSVLPGKNQNITTNIVAGMKATVLPNHRCGFIVGGNAMYLAMPRLPSTEPYISSNVTDKNTGANLRLYYGYIPDKGVKGFVRSIIYGYKAVDEYCMKIAFPVR
jgi:hypothetical protein